MKTRHTWRRFLRVAGSVSIRTKIMGIVALLVLGFGVFMGWYIPRSEEEYLTDQLEERGLTIARNVATLGQDMVLTNNQFGLYMLARNTVNTNKDVSYVFVTNGRGEPLVHTFEGGFPLDLLKLSQSNLNEDPQIVPLLTENGKIRDVSLPILGNKAGMVHVGLDESGLLAYGATHARRILSITALALLVGIVFAYALATVLTRPIARLEMASKQIADSDFSWRAPLWAGDEIGRLGKAFSEMARKVSERTKEIVQRNNELTTLNAVSQALSHSPNLNEKLSSAVNTISRGLELNAVWLFLLNPQSRKLELFSHHSVLADISPEMLDDMAGWMVNELSDTDGPKVLEVGGGTLPGFSAKVLSDRRLLPIVVIPIRAEQRRLGFLVASKNGSGTFSPTDMRLLTAVGEQVGVAFENSILWQELKQKEKLRTHLLAKVISAQEQERKRIARELHDQTSQSLTSMMVGLKVAEESSDTASIKQRVSELRTLASRTLEEVRDLSMALRPSVLDDLGLVPAINRYIHDYAQKTGLSVQFQTVGFNHERLMPEVETAIYRVIQEALTNIVRHAAAKHVSVILEQSGNKLLAITEDDGRGFDVDQVMAGPSLEIRLGLFGMEERIALIGGRLTIESAPGKGTTVFVEVPLDENRS